MKVKVNTRVNGAPAKAVIMTHEKYAALLNQIEKLIQENKDLRVSEGHLQDDLTILQRNKNLSDAAVEAWRNKCERAEQESRDWYSQYLSLQEKASNETCALRDALNDRNARVDELEKQVEFWKKATDENAYLAKTTTQEAEQWRIKYETEHKTYEEDKEKADAICKNCDAIYEKVVTERNDLHQKLEEANEQIEYYKTQELVFQDAEKDFKNARTYYEDLLRQKAHEQSELMEKLADVNRQLAEAHKRIEEQQRIIADAGETIANQQRPKYRSLWDLLTEHGLIIDATTLPSNSTNRPQE